MSNQHSVNHNDAFTFVGAHSDNHWYDSVVSMRDRMMDDVRLAPIPWKQIHRANVPHLTRHSR